MRRIAPHLVTIVAAATLATAANPAAAVSVAQGRAAATGAASGPSVSTSLKSGAKLNKAQINAAVQEALKKAQAEGKIGGSGATPAGESPASSGAFSNLTSGGANEPETSNTARAATSLASSSGSASTGLLVAIFVAAGLLLAVIAFFIVRDARSVAPAGGVPARNLSSDRAAKLRKRRAKAKAARAHRKRNR